MRQKLSLLAQAKQIAKLYLNRPYGTQSPDAAYRGYCFEQKDVIRKGNTGHGGHGHRKRPKYPKLFVSTSTPTYSRSEV